jgi:hypothetical protein
MPKSTKTIAERAARLEKLLALKIEIDQLQVERIAESQKRVATGTHRALIERKAVRS